MIELDKNFIKSVNENYPINKDKIIEAYKFANEMHDGVYRKSGEPYIVHPVAIAQILIDNNMDYSTIMAGLLHDVVEDTDATIDDIKKRFGETVAKLVDGVTKINQFKVEAKAKALSEEESMKHLLLAMGKDMRVIFIKLADRLHNMQTIEFLKREKQIRMATETENLFIPIAERIGVRKLRSELQALTFKCLHPEEYKALKTEIVRKLTKRKEGVDNIEKKMKRMLSRNGIECKIIGWPEHTYSVYKKMNNQIQDISNVYTLMLYRVIVPTVDDCYRTLGLLHKVFNPVPSQIKDHIAMPKPNGYQSLHTVLLSEDADIAFKVMIRTYEMDKTCEFGISSLWQNKDADEKFNDKFEKHNNLKEIILGEDNKLNTTSSFIDAIRADLSPTSTWVLTPKLKPVCVSVANPTAIDFAYAVHTSIGNNAISAVINGKKASLKDTLKSGDVVEIILSEKKKAPSRTWLSIVKSSVARKRIREYISRHTTNEYIELGKEKLKAELAKTNRTLENVEAIFDIIQEELNFVSLEDMYASVGYEGVTTSQITSFVLKNDKNKKTKNDSPVELVSGEEQTILIPKCCCPVYGDEIVGITSKNGVTIHTCNCINLKNMDASRFVDVVWKEGIDRCFDVNLKVVSKNAVGYASKLLGIIAKENVNISKIVAKEVNSNNDCEIDVCVGVKNNEELGKLIAKIKTIKEVKTVNRFFE